MCPGPHAGRWPDLPRFRVVAHDLAGTDDCRHGARLQRAGTLAARAHRSARSRVKMLLQVRDLSVEFGPAERPVRAVDHVDLALAPGEIVGVAGESGSGKTTLCAALIRALPRSARISGEVICNGRSIYALSMDELRAVRGREIAMVLQ